MELPNQIGDGERVPKRLKKKMTVRLQDDDDRLVTTRRSVQRRQRQPRAAILPLLFITLMTVLCITTAVMAMEERASSSSSAAENTCEVTDGSDSCQNDNVAAAATDGSTTKSSSSADTNNDDEVECGIYMAPSTLGDFTNLGMYTSIPRKKNEILPYPEIVLPLLFRNWETHPNDRVYGDGQLWERYVWEGEVGNVESYGDYGKERFNHQSIFVPGLGCTVNSNLDLNNIKSAHGSVYSLEGVPRSYPTAGSFTPYHEGITKVNAKDGIPAGGELFASYGESWIPSIPDAAIALHKNLRAANTLLQDYVEFIEELQSKYDTNDDGNGKKDKNNNNNNTIITPRLIEQMYDMIRNFPRQSSRKEFSVLPLEIDPSVILKTINDNKISKKKSESNSKTKQNTSSSSKPKTPRPLPASMDTYQYWKNRGVMSVDWLKQNGYCQDHMRPGPSTIPHAGKGAFATRDLPKGTVVGYAPLIHVGKYGKEMLTINYANLTKATATKTSNDDNGNIKRKLNYQKLDLIINYSFGHDQSTMLLTPYGAMVNYINHAIQPRYQPNVQIRWPNKELTAHKPEWVTDPNKNATFFQNVNQKIGLSFEYIATRDIKQNEEILLDYGRQWENAFLKHVQNWKAPIDANTYLHSTLYEKLEQEKYYQKISSSTTSSSSSSMPSVPKSKLPLKTPQEEKDDPYPSNLHTLCIESYRKETNDNNNNNNRNVNENDERYVFIPVLRTSAQRVQCQVLGRYETNDTDGSGGDVNYHYTVEITTSKRNEGGGEKIIVHQVTRPDGIDIYDEAYSQDWHLKEAFRHKMYIPDEIFPASWKNL